MNYDAWKTRAPEEECAEPESPCLCRGDENGTPCTEACERLYELRASRAVDESGAHLIDTFAPTTTEAA